MTIVEKAQKIEKKPLPLKLPVELLARLEQYAVLVNRKFLGADRAEIVAALLTYALDDDADFAAAEGREPVRRRRTRTADNDGA
jgi:hypothetical protein